MPLLFAVTLFTSASLLFMVQPMVGKMVLPLLGGSPAVWNACMVFFQALLLLGYLYAHKLSDVESPRKQWMIHLAVLALPLTVFALAAVFSSRHSPIAIVESLAPTDERSPIISVLLILTVAIGIPFFVISTTATLLQKWFVFTGHPSSRDPYFLYAASNFGSLISLLGYPFLIEPWMTPSQQGWVFAAGFAILTALIYFCGQAAANPIGIPPSPQGGGKGSKGTQQAKDNGNTTANEPPPTLGRKLKWVALAFVPSTLMLGVTFHMTTDIASIPLLWVGPLALYLITFIIAFGRVPDWFRMVIGNLAPVMILLLVFVLISGVNPGVGVTLGLHMLTFFAAALMCHYELARDRPAPQYLTGFFLLMSVGGVLGGAFNSLIAPLVFPYSYEYPIALVIACLMVPKLLEEEKDKTTLGVANPVAHIAVGAMIVNPIATIGRIFMRGVDRSKQLALLLDVAIPLAVGIGFYYLTKLTEVEWFAATCNSIAKSVGLSLQTISVVVLYAVPVMMCFFFVDRPLRFALCVAAILGPTTIRESRANLVHSERSFFGILRVSEEKSYQYLKGPRFVITEQSIGLLRKASVPDSVLSKLDPMRDRWFNPLDNFVDELNKLLDKSEADQFRALILANAEKEEVILRYPTGAVNAEGKSVSGEPMVAGKFVLRKLVHGTTLHGTQVAEHDRHILDDFQMLGGLGSTPWDTLAVAGAIASFDVRQEPLTYYHRTGPVGMMVSELRNRKNGADAKAHFSMVGLGTGSASCYVQPGQKLTFYEIDPAVKHLVADTDKWFTYVTEGRRRARTIEGGDLDIRMGDARLKLKDATDQKYALLLVDAFSSDSIPVHLLTVEAVQLYLSRMTEDGILALHISNKFVKLEPVVARIAGELGLTARVWNDDGERRPGKTASSWVVLARKPEHLGALYVPIGDLIFGPPPAKPGADDRMEVSMENQLFQGLANDYDELRETGVKKAKYAEMNELPSDKVKDAWLTWVKEKLAKTTDPFHKDRLTRYQALIEKYSPFLTFQEVMMREHGHAFRRLETMSQVPAWTDDYADVMRVMMIPELQSIRSFFGLPTPIKR